VAELEGQDHSAAGVESSIGAASPFSPTPTTSSTPRTRRQEQRCPDVPRGDDGPWHGEGMLLSGSYSLTL
jgi:hypothetical protein